MAKRGRPTRLTKALLADFVDIVREGNYRKVAAQLVGIDERTAIRWMALGEEKPRSIHGEFCRQVLEAEAEAERKMLLQATTFNNQGPQHAQWYLARKFSDRWADKSRIQVDQTVTTTDEADKFFEVATPEQKAMLAELSRQVRDAKGAEEE